MPAAAQRAPPAPGPAAVAGDADPQGAHAARLPARRRPSARGPRRLRSDVASWSARSPAVAARTCSGRARHP
ncbi:hypothetical protein AN217_13410 [Streptomyces qinglanensis]|uniref:Uncharacterized protein n=1 Tax=Streptomyces qinglanensis TaxID=943816 RepID=A0A1E7K412_9ACTN|nr:hypothetical protein AN217_13410 [Streptomyces qinglanensis]